MSEIQRDRIDMALEEHHKANLCPIDGHTLCQEGYCSNCEINDRLTRMLAWLTEH